MMLFGSPEFKVGMLVVVVSGLIGVMSLKVAEGPGFFGGQKKYWFDVPNAGGLVNNSAVKMAGIKVGTIRDIELVGGRARVHLSVDDEVGFTTSGHVELRTDGILGDKHVELMPGNPTDPKLPSGSQIVVAVDKGSIDKMLNEVGNITGALKTLTETLNNATTGEGDTTTPLGRIIVNLENLSSDLADISGRNREKLNDLIDRTHSLMSNLDSFVADESPEGFKAAWQKAIDSLSRVDRSLKNIEEITAKVNEGEGTLGRLVNDEETVDQINTAVENVNEFLGGAREMETSIDFHSEYLGSVDLTKSYLAFKVKPGLDRYYELAIIDDPRGAVQETETYTESTPGGESHVNETKYYKNQVKFTALFAKNFYDLTVKGGIIENFGGLGVDYHLFREKLRLSVELFDFETPYGRAFAKYNFFKGVYFIGGADNMFSSDEFSGFIGGGIFLTNDDLKVLASSFAF